MKKKSTLTLKLFCALFIASICKAQIPNLNFANKLGLSGNDLYINKIKLDTLGNLYAVGSADGIVDFDPSPSTATLAISNPTTIGISFLAKYSSTGAYQWVIPIGNVNDGVYSSHIAFDVNNNPIIAGGYYGNTDFDPSASVATLTVGAGSQSVFFAKYSATNGAYLFARGVTGNNNIILSSLLTDATGNIFISGRSKGTIDFDPSATNYTVTSNLSSDDGYFAKYSSTGSFIWVNTLGSNQTDMVSAMSLDPSGNVLISGLYYNTIDFDPSPATFTLNAGISSQSQFVAKYSTAGNFNWAFTINGGSSSFGDVSGMVTDNTGNVYITGGVSENTIDFDPSAGTATTNINGYTDSYLAKYNGSTGAFIWFKNIMRTIGSNDYNYPQSIVYDKTGAGSIYVGGYIAGAADLDPSATTFTLASSFADNNSLYSKFDLSGNLAWAFITPSSLNNSENYNVSLDYNNQFGLYTAGQFTNQSPDLDPSTNTYTLANMINSSLENAYIARYFNCVAPNSPSNTTNASNTLICVGQTTTLTANGSGTITWLSSPTSTNNLATGSSFATSTLSSGNYTYYAVANTCTTSIATAITFSVSTCTDVKSGTLNSTSNLNVYPNPSNGVFNISNASGAELNVIVINTLGQTIISKKISIESGTIDLSGYAKGVYYLKAGNKIVKVVKE
jgi:hypothetical protein